MFSLKCFWTCLLQAAAMAFFVYSAYTVRMHAINIYGLVIHEFDPWFNFRATQYLVRIDSSVFKSYIIVYVGRQWIESFL